jgi:hypothetical protein
LTKGSPVTRCGVWLRVVSRSDAPHAVRCRVRRIMQAPSSGSPRRLGDDRPVQLLYLLRVHRRLLSAVPQDVRAELRVSERRVGRASGFHRPPRTERLSLDHVFGGERPLRGHRPPEAVRSRRTWTSSLFLRVHELGETSWRVTGITLLPPARPRTRALLSDPHHQRHIEPLSRRHTSGSDRTCSPAPGPNITIADSCDRRVALDRRSARR